MFTRTFSVGKNRALRPAVSLVLALGLVVGMMALAGCTMDDDGDSVDDPKLNVGLVGTWKTSGTYPDENGNDVSWSDTYTITDDTDSGKRLGAISHPDGFSPYHDASIVFVYNFSETAGCLIVKYTDGADNGKYNAVYYKDLSSVSVRLGDAYDTTIAYPGNNNSSVATLDEAKTKFAPENAEAYGGASAQTGAALPKQ
ncbi:MAG: hypothetical protein LBP76_11400 [Treponema sp.]|jgi:hypothetical protein|nr:hypothetical protein [Treponema sp.]